MHPEDYTTTTRAAAVAWRLARGERLHVMRIATEYGIARQNAHNMMVNMSLVLPIVCESGTWSEMQRARPKPSIPIR